MVDDKRRPSRLADEELRKARLRVSDPYEQDGLVWKIPPGAELVDIINTYAFERWPEEKVWCIKCGGHRHKHGFTAQLSDGSLVLVGSKCGSEIFKETWDQAHNRLRDRSQRQTLLFRLDDLLMRMPEIVARLRGWYEACCLIESENRRFKLMMRPLHTGLRAAANREGGKLIAYERVRDLVAEAEAGEDDDGPKWKHNNEVVHTTAGARFFYDISPEEELRAAFRVLRDIEHAAADTGTLTTSAMKGFGRRLQDMVERLEFVAGMYKDMFAFFAPANLAAVAAWATRTNHVEGTYQAAGTRLYWEERDAWMGPPATRTPP